ncbi:hypothetical protein GmHk_10G028643 [Glycine max]|nr:hypothetical protein GmHk_10G028643 [Glycine max]
MNNIIIMQQNETKASFEHSIHVVGHTFNVCIESYCRRGYRMQFIGVDTSCRGCIVRSTHRLPCVYELARYALCSIQLQAFDAITKRLKEVDITAKITIKNKLRDISFSDMTSMCPPVDKVKTKGSQKGHPSFFEHVDALHSQHDNQFHGNLHPYISDIVDVRSDGHCGYRAVAALLGMGEDSWPIIHNDFHKELGQWRDEYANIFRGYDCLYQIKQSLLVDHVSTIHLTDRCPIPGPSVLWSTHCYPLEKE